MKVLNRVVLSLLINLLVFTNAYAISENYHLPEKWIALKPIITSRVNQQKQKMKLSKKEADSLIDFLNKLKEPTPSLEQLEKTMPKTTVELLRSVESRNVPLTEAEKMAAYLNSLMQKFQFQNPGPFDENTSHIIGRNWSEIDYSDENMTWQNQQKKYQPYGITNFKTVENLKKFFPVESKLPYFRKIYRPKY